MRLQITCCIAVMFAVAGFGATNSVPTKLPPQGKGYCLYGYHSSNLVFFVLMPGTNRTKTFQEIDAASSFVKNSWFHLKAQGLDDGKGLIDRVNSEFLFISGIREASDVNTTTIPNSVSSASDDEIDALKEYWAQKQKK